MLCNDYDKKIKCRIGIDEDRICRSALFFLRNFAYYKESKLLQQRNIVNIMFVN